MNPWLIAFLSATPIIGFVLGWYVGRSSTKHLR